MIIRPAVAIAFGLLGCSFIGVRNPPEQPPIHAPIDCKDSSVLPMIDTVPAIIGLGFGGLLTIGGLSCQPGGGSSCDGAVIGLIVGVPMLAIGALYTASAVHGRGATSRCRDAKRHQDEHDAICDGGRRNVNNLCYCPDGQTWGGHACMGTPLAQECSGGAYAFGPPNDSQCFCLDGFAVNNGQCVETAQAAKQHLEEEDAKKHTSCLQQRHEIFERAGKISDPQERAPLLESMPICNGEAPPPPTREPSDFDRTQRRERAEMRMRAAFDAARTGDCATVVKLDVEVREIDAEFHNKVFVRDVGLARCLAGNVDAPPITPAHGPVPESP